MPTALLLNGPPGVGKDTLADMLVEFGFTKLAFKDQLYLDTVTHYNLDTEQGSEFLRRAKDRELKEEVWDVTGESPRTMLIKTSEDYIKPNFGKDYFGKAAVVMAQEKGAYLAVFSDSGFYEELEALKEWFDTIIVCRLRREGYTFDGDSRQYLEGLDNTHDIYLYEELPYPAVVEIAGIVDEYLDGSEVDDLLFG